MGGMGGGGGGMGGMPPGMAAAFSDPEIQTLLRDPEVMAKLSEAMSSAPLPLCVCFPPLSAMSSFVQIPP